VTAGARGRAGVSLVICLSLTGACATRLYSPPAGPGLPFAEAAGVWRDVTARCSTTRVFVAEVRVDGWVGASRQRFSAALHAAFTRENDVYLEVPGPGRSYVQIAGRGERAVLLLPRDERVLREPTRDIVEALTGLKWDAVDLLNVLSGCVTNAGAEVTGVAHGEDQAAVELGAGARAWLRRVGGVWQVEAATRDGLLVEYRAREGAFPSDVRVSDASPGTTPLLVTFRVSQVSANVPLLPATFELTVPPAFTPMTLDDLRSVRPLGDVKRVP
jgi:hypothetical protein